MRPKRIPSIFSLIAILAFPAFLAATVLEGANQKAQEQNKKRSSRQEERTDYYKNWLNKDVVYIITDEERKVFDSLTTPDEKDNFIEQFWLRRDPDPRTSLNEFREEHYRRIAYANDHFTSGVDGWATDRGRIYIKFGPPTHIDRHPTGHTYDRPIREGGGTTTTYPYEVWYYQHIEGVGTGIEIEFVDPTSTGEYEIATRDTDKDALMYVTGGGETLFEMLGLENRLSRIRKSDAGRPLGLGDDLVNPGANPFDKLKHYVDLDRPPAVKFKDLQALVNTSVYYHDLPFSFRTDLLHVSSEEALVALTLGVDRKELTYKAGIPGSQVEDAQIQVYAALQSLDRRIVYEFDDTVLSYAPRGKQLQPGLSLYQHYIPLRHGRYKLSIVLKEERSGKIGTAETLVIVPAINAESPAMSSIILASQIGPAIGEEFPAPFVTASSLKIYPNIAQVFPLKAPLGLYAEIYNLQIDQSSLRPSADVSCQVLSSSGEIIRQENLTSTATVFYAQRASVARLWPNLDLAPGRYTLRLTVADRIAKKATRQDTQFTIIANP